MQRIQNLVLILIIVLAACDKEASSEQRGTEIRKETIYNEETSKLCVPVKLTNKTSSGIRLDLCTFRYSLFNKGERIQKNESFSGILIAAQIDPDKYDHTTRVNFLPNHNTSFNLIIPVTDKVKEIIEKKELDIEITVKNEKRNVVAGPNVYSLSESIHINIHEPLQQNEVYTPPSPPKTPPPSKNH